jgi:hypothetical protein
MNPEVSRACAALKNAMNLPPGPELDRLIAAAESAESLTDLPKWVRDGLRNIGWPGEY